MNFFLLFEALLLLRERQTFGLQLPHASCVSIQRTECADTTKQDAVRRRFKDLDRSRTVDLYIYIYTYIYISWQRQRWPPNWGLAEARPNEEHSAKKLECIFLSSFLAELFHFLFHANHILHIDHYMPNFDWPPCKTIRLSLMSLFSLRCEI